jgi:hypothetical protein
MVLSSFVSCTFLWPCYGGGAVIAIEVLKVQALLSIDVSKLDLL